MSANTLVCFAVKEEAIFFRKMPAAACVDILLVGMGKANADKSIRSALATNHPTLVLTCGFAGGLNPSLTSGDVLFATDEESPLTAKLLAAGARAARFHCADKVAVTAEEKWALWQTTGADAVEMESEIIRKICREQNIPSATVRVILDQAGEDLPLDFNALMTPNLQMDFGKLALTILKSPGKVGALMRLQKQSRAAAEQLARALAQIISD